MLAFSTLSRPQPCRSLHAPFVSAFLSPLCFPHTLRRISSLSPLPDDGRQAKSEVFHPLPMLRNCLNIVHRRGKSLTSQASTESLPSARRPMTIPPLIPSNPLLRHPSLSPLVPASLSRLSTLQQVTHLTASPLLMAAGGIQHRPSFRGSSQVLWPRDVLVS